jgi:cell migration-inducing and hyaluronan-binding protein
VVLSRNGKEFELTATTIRAGTEIKVATERPSVSLTLTELDPGSWVLFELPGFTTAASGTEQSSLDALRAASDTSYFRDQDALWVKVVSTADGGRGGGGSLQVSQ